MRVFSDASQKFVSVVVVTTPLFTRPCLDTFGVMGGVGRFGVLAVESPDPVLSVVGPIGLAASVGTALVIDFVGGLQIRSDRTLADLIEDGPTRSELSPGRSGVALLSGHTVEPELAVSAIEELSAAWPAVVLRCRAGQLAVPTVPVRPLFPGYLLAADETPAVWQPVGAGIRPPGPGPVLPRLSSSLARRLLAGRLPVRSRWVASWRRVWEMPWA